MEEVRATGDTGIVGSSAGQFGTRRWCIQSKLSDDGEIYAMADEARVLSDGTLALIRFQKGKPPATNLAFAPGNWIAVCEVSLSDGSAVAVDQWA